MIVVDMSNMVFSLASTIDDYNIDSLRHTVLTKLANAKLKLKKYDDSPMVLAYDSRVGYWRKLINQYYKAKRGKQRAESKFDWEQFFIDYDILIKEFKENLPFASIVVDLCEGDDIIAVLARYRNPQGTMAIYSNDGDMYQLRKYGVVQLSVISKKGFLDNSKYDIFEHVVKGDADDGVPNILSPIDTLVTGIRQVTMTKKKYDLIYENKHDPVLFCNDAAMLDRYTMNKKLIDLDEIPQEYVDNILHAYDNVSIAKGKVFGYCVKHKLTKFLANGGFH